MVGEIMIGMSGVEEEDDDLPEALGQVFTHWTCPHCDHENTDCDGDCDGETLECDSCDQRSVIRRT